MERSFTFSLCVYILGFDNFVCATWKITQCWLKPLSCPNSESSNKFCTIYNLLGIQGRRKCSSVNAEACNMQTCLKTGHNFSLKMLLPFFYQLQKKIEESFFQKKEKIFGSTRTLLHLTVCQEPQTIAHINLLKLALKVRIQESSVCQTRIKMKIFLR